MYSSSSITTNGTTHCQMIRVERNAQNYGPHLLQQWWPWSGNPAPRLLGWPAASGAGWCASPSGPSMHFPPTPAPGTNRRQHGAERNTRKEEQRARFGVTSAVRYSRMAALYTAAVAPTRPWLVVLDLRCLWMRPTGNYTTRGQRTLMRGLTGPST